MATMCLSAIGSGATLPKLNRYKNTKTPITEVSNVLETCPLDNYGESNGERCGTCCFTEIEQHDITAVILHNCETGEIIDFQCPVQGVTCPEEGEENAGNVCIEMTCWTLKGYCPEPEPLPVCIDPCAKCDEIMARMSLLDTPQTSSWKNADKGESLKCPSFDDLQKQYRFWLKKCRACRGQGRRLRISHTEVYRKSDCC